MLLLLGFPKAESPLELIVVRTQGHLLIRCCRRELLFASSSIQNPMTISSIRHASCRRSTGLRPAMPCAAVPAAGAGVGCSGCGGACHGEVGRAGHILPSFGRPRPEHALHRRPLVGIRQGHSHKPLAFIMYNKRALSSHCLRDMPPF